MHHACHSGYPCHSTNVQGWWFVTLINPPSMVIIPLSRKYDAGCSSQISCVWLPTGVPLLRDPLHFCVCLHTTSSIHLMPLLVERSGMLYSGSSSLGSSLVLTCLPTQTGYPQRYKRDLHMGYPSSVACI